MVWAITCSNFDIDLHFEDDMQIGAKIKLAEIVVQSLQKMKCPHRIEPFQI